MATSRLSARLRRELLAPIEGIVFDKDGTLIDLDARWVGFFRSIISTVAAAGDDPGAEQSLAAVLGVGTDRIEPEAPAATKTQGELLEIAIGHLVGRGWSADDALSAIGTAIETAEFGPLRPIGDVADAIQRLSAGYRLGLATSDNRDSTIDELARLGIDRHLSRVHCGDDGGPVKPDPEVLLGFGRYWGLEPLQMLFVGDSEQDLVTARQAGSAFVAVVTAMPSESAVDPPSPLAAEADAWIISIEELAR